MDDTSASSASSSASDSDAYNTESARLYFGPVKTPERKFVANTRCLFPPQVPYPLRRSPRLSSPRPPPTNRSFAIDQDSAAQEAKDIDLVAELVNEVEVEDDEQRIYPVLETPQRLEDVEQDEPLSALADKVLHAVDNPSPPPSPATALKMFDPFHPANVTDSAEYEDDFLFPHPSQGPTAHDRYPLIRLSDSSNMPELEAFNQDLIVLESPDHLPTLKRIEPLDISQQLMSVDDLLANSPDTTVLHQPCFDHEPTDEANFGDVAEDLMSVDLPNETSGEGQPASGHTQEGHIQDEPYFSVPIQQPFAEAAIVTPLRRSTRPRKSLAPTPSPQPLPIFTAPSPARTFVKKKDQLRNSDEDNSQDDHDDQKSTSRTLLSTPRRSRSPSKEPFLFHREVGSLSPASASVLSSLAFNSIDIPEQTIDPSSSRSAEPPPVLSFSVFAPSEGTADGVSTPVRADGPKRVPSSPKIENSPRKFRLQSPSPNDLASTPARRILIEQAIAEGQLSPERAARIGFKATNGNSTPSVVSTPARRVLMSEKSLTPGFKTAMPRLESPVKPLAIHKEPLGVPPRHVIPSLKSKEKPVAHAFQGTSSSGIKQGNLPFPILATSSTTIESQAPGVVQKLPNSVSSPAKPTLKVTSKIPRITKKPYARKVPEKSASATISTSKQSDSGKPHSTPQRPSVPKRPIRLVETANIQVNLVSRPKPTISTSSTSTVLVKRKREENSLPSKPQTTVLRQVPSLASRRPAANIKTQTTDNEPAPLPTDQQTNDIIRVRRVVTPPPQEHLVPKIPCEDLTTKDPRLYSGAQEPPSSLEGNHLSPASPMKQDHPEELQPAEPPSSSIPPSVPAEAPPPLSESGTSGLRRTTRSRKYINPPDSSNVPRKTTRRKAVTQQFDDVFSGMSLTALKELTMTNTEKNQHYLAAKLETEVVRKEGLRPESPAVKIRTISQRQQEDKERQRAARAKRRARMLGKDDGSTSDIEASSDAGYLSPIEESDMDTTVDGEGPRKHTKGAGDDEDYQTPERPLRDVRVRLFDDGCADRQPDRRVKWDRGLFTFVYLDEVSLGSRQNLKENRTLRGILAPASKALRLDTLGNLLHEDTPLTDLVPENVTVKKFVYDNDFPAPEPPAPKTTRSKSKRK